GYFKVNRNNYFKIDRQESRSTLSVLDQFKNEVLFLHLANKNALFMRASFYYRGIPIHIDSPKLFGSHPEWNIGGNCFRYNTPGAAMRFGKCLVQ
ncbi:MAG: hypothetical protein WB676_17355, partial [Bryobacteraceae bacterium]